MGHASASRAPAEPVPDAAGFSGYSGCDEQIRTELLKGRVFSKFDKAQRQWQFHDTNVDLGTKQDIPPYAIPGRRKHHNQLVDETPTPAGASTRYGLCTTHYDVISGVRARETASEIFKETVPPRYRARSIHFVCSTRALYDLSACLGAMVVQNAILSLRHAAAVAQPHGAYCAASEKSWENVT